MNEPLDKVENPNRRGSSAPLRSSMHPAMLLVCLAAYFWFAVWLPWHGLHSNDFKHLYLGMKALLDGDEPYSPLSLFHHAALNEMMHPKLSLNPYVYLPFTGLAMSFLAPFSFSQAAAIWFLLNHLFALVACWLIARELYPDTRLRAFGILLFALAMSSPMARTLTAGQLNLTMLFCATAAFCLLLRGRDKTAGAVLGFAACFKLAPALFLLYFAIRRRWSALGVMSGTIAVCLAISLGAVGWKVHAAFLPVLQQMRYGHSSWEHIWQFHMTPPTFWKDPTNQSFNSLFTHVFVGDNAITPWLQGTQGVANVATWGVSLLLLAAYLWCMWSRDAEPVKELQFEPRISGISDRDQALFHTTLLLMLLLPSLMWDHYLVLALLPVSWLVQFCHKRRYWKTTRLVVACYMIICVPWQFDAEIYRQGAGLLLMSAKLWPTVVLFGVCCWVALKAKGEPAIPVQTG
ncbi:MAG: glycosyltransferase family 87 protein [Candidatus Sumerlaeaceae bacterium]